VQVFGKAEIMSENSLRLLITEENGHSSRFYEFDAFRLDARARLLWRGAEVVPLMPKAFDVLLALVRRHGEVVTKDELLANVWRDAVVEENSLNVNVSALRKVFGEKPRENRFIVTVPGVGYKFVADVQEVEETPPENTLQQKETKEADEPRNDQAAASKQSKTGNLIHTIKHRPAFALIFTSILALSVFLASTMIYRRKTTTPHASATKRSIAVLPLKPVNTNARDLIYELGIADSLILKLGAARSVTVRPLSATRKYLDVEQDATVAGREQKVDYVLDSNYELSNGRIRVTSQLVNVETGAIEETLRSEKDAADVFSMQDSIADDFGRVLLARFGETGNAQTARHYTTNEEAYRLYLQGDALVNKRGYDEGRKAVECFEQAIKLDPNYALAYAGLAYAHVTIYIGGGDPREEYPLAKRAVERALQLDGNLAEAYAVLGDIQTAYDWDFPAAEQSFRRAIELNPNSAFAHRQYAFHLKTQNRFDEAIAESKRAIDIDPNSAFTQRSLGMVLFFARRYDEAIAHFERVVDMDSSRSSMVYNWLSRAFAQKGDYDQAFEAFLHRELNRSRMASREEIDAWRNLYAQSGWRGVLQRRLEIAEQDSDFGDASAYSAELGDKEKAFAYLEKCYQERALCMPFSYNDPSLDLLRDDPRYHDLVRRAGLPE
jgi:DNA-binding winged helix-turn-helix (wHTH) protein/tetratricopeptide (TPR) repeat protein